MQAIQHMVRIVKPGGQLFMGERCLSLALAALVSARD